MEEKTFSRAVATSQCFDLYTSGGRVKTIRGEKALTLEDFTTARSWREYVVVKCPSAKGMSISPERYHAKINL